ncbi:MAG TPA: hypothetical protein VEC06_08530 [Paucimonas sp.]|nr:hypothetical protein [Paucimonas sp.]
MTTLRETFVKQILDLQTPALVAINAKTERSLKAAISAEDGDTLVVHRGAEELRDQVLGATDCFVEILLSVVTHDDAPDAAADAVMEVAHPIVMAYTHGAIIDIQQGNTDEPKYTNGRACVVTTHYLIHYRRSESSLSA